MLETTEVASGAGPLRHLAQIARRQFEVRAWTAVRWEEAPRSGPLSGMTLGVKDTIDVEGLTTECGSPIHSGRRAAANAAIVRRFVDAGATVIGKTTCAEFAWRTPPPTRNPLDLSRSPGGSSSGSAAAVADEQVDVAIGTQTAGSIIRPAAYCGVVGFKAGQGQFDMAGVMPSSPSLDSLGWFAVSVAVAARVWFAVAPSEPVEPPPIHPKVRIHLGPEGVEVDPRLLAALRMLTDEFMAEAARPLPIDEVNVHHTLLQSEMRWNLRTELRLHRTRLSAGLVNFLERDPIGPEAYARARDALLALDEEQVFDGADVILTPSAAGVAPLFGTTGDPGFSRAWTLLGLPSISVPIMGGIGSLPLGVQVVGRRGRETAMLSTASAVESVLHEWGARAQ